MLLQREITQSDPESLTYDEERPIWMAKYPTEYERQRQKMAITRCMTRPNLKVRPNKTMWTAKSSTRNSEATRYRHR